MCNHKWKFAGWLNETGFEFVKDKSQPRFWTYYTGKTSQCPIISCDRCGARPFNRPRTLDNLDK